MKNIKKLSWQIPFLLFLILGTYYTLTQKNGPSTQWTESGSIHGIPYTLSCHSSQKEREALHTELKNISKGLEHVLQSDSAATSPDSVSARVYRMIIDLIKAKQIQDYQLQVGNRHTDAG